MVLPMSVSNMRMYFLPCNTDTRSGMAVCSFSRISKFCARSSVGRSVYSLHSCGILNTAAVCVSSQSVSVQTISAWAKAWTVPSPLSELFVSHFFLGSSIQICETRIGVYCISSNNVQKSLTKRVRFCMSWAHSWTLKSSLLVNTSWSLPFFHHRRSRRLVWMGRLLLSCWFSQEHQLMLRSLVFFSVCYLSTSGGNVYVIAPSVVWRWFQILLLHSKVKYL